MAEKQVKSIADIARLANVSKSTVSRALSNSPLIAQETRERIQAIARENNFCVNASARQLSMQESHTIGFVTQAYHKEFSIADLFTLEIMGGISRGLFSKGYEMLIIHINLNDVKWAQKYLDSGRVDGFVLMPCSNKQKHMQELARIGAPFSVWDAPQANFKHCSVTGDNIQGGRLATDYLIKLGRKKIAFLGGPADELEVQLRFEGYKDTLKKTGRDLEPSLVIHGDYSIESGAIAMSKLIEQNPDLDAVFVNSDLMAMAAIKKLRSKGYRVPEDIAVMGYDDLSIAEYNDPALTTVRQNIPGAGVMMAQNLVQYIETGAISNITMPVELVIRESA
jgi:DNA-binding LacI/PurR family transcriptional regulator